MTKLEIAIELEKLIIEVEKVLTINHHNLVVAAPRKRKYIEDVQNGMWAILDKLYRLSKEVKR